MLVVETIARIRREFFVKDKSIKEIVRDLKVSRNTVRKVLRSGATAFAYEREVQPLPKLGRWKDHLDRLLVANEAKPGRERLTLIRLFEELRELGYAGGDDAASQILLGSDNRHYSKCLDCGEIQLLEAERPTDGAVYRPLRPIRPDEPGLKRRLSS
jgi:predicted DNA-binding protein YlxM (UPF0122 family)